MSDKYSTGVRFNHQMGVLETVSFVGEGIGAGLYIGAILTGQQGLAALGVLAVFGAVVALLLHLGRPARSWRAMARLATSGVSRGTAVISGFLGLSILSLLAGQVGFLAALKPPATVGALVFALPVIVYAGLLLRSMKAIRLWRGPFVPLSFAAQSLASATTLIAWLAAGTVLGAVFQVLALACLLLAAVLAATHLLRAERSAGVLASLDRLLAGDLRTRFLLGAWGLGIVVPLAGVAAAPLLASGAAPAAATLALALAALSRIGGDFAYRNCIVMAGAYEPIAPLMPQRPLGNTLS